MVKQQRLTGLFFAALTLVLVFSFAPVSSDSNLILPAVHTASAQGPTPTPADPVWIAFDTARKALEEELEQNIRFVQQYTWAQVEFVDGISSCVTLEEDEQPEYLFFGYRFVITLLNGNQYEVRTSLDSTIYEICDGVTNTSVVAEEPVVAATSPDVAAPVTAPVGPGGLEVGGQVTGLFPETRNALNQAGMRWAKKQITNAVSFGDAVAFINEGHAAGYKVLLSVLGDIPSIMDPARQDDYAAYVGSLAEAGADGIECWNEPNIEREWPAGQINGGNYTQLLAKCYNAVKAKNPNTLVISGGPAPTGFFGAAGCNANGCNDDVFYQQMAQAGAANYMDCVGAHYNEGVVSPTLNSGDPRDNYGTRYYQSNLARVLSPFPGKQACFTELGYLTGEGYSGLPGGFAWAGDTSLAEHAQWLGEAVGIAKAAGNVRLLIVFNVDFKTFTDDPQAGFAIIRPDGACPACAQIRAAIG